MIKPAVFALILFSCILFPSCMMLFRTEESLPTTPVFGSSDLPSDQYIALFREFSSFSGAVAMGISGPSTDRDRAVGKATEEALRYLAYNRGMAMEVRYGRTVDTSSRTDRFGTLSGGGTSDRIMEECASEMKIEKISWYGGRIGAAVFVSRPGMKKLTIPSDWMSNTPDIAGWNTASGSVASDGLSMQDAIETAIYRAARSLLDEDDRSVSVNVTLENTSSSSYSNDTFQISGNRFSSFTVLALGYDPVSGKVHALVGSRTGKDGGN